METLDSIVFVPVQCSGLHENLGLVVDKEYSQTSHEELPLVVNTEPFQSILSKQRGSWDEGFLVEYLHVARREGGEHWGTILTLTVDRDSEFLLET